jgi:hypothetical protein
MNRPPQPADRWFAEHQARCGGQFFKVKEPDTKAQQQKLPDADGLECPVCLKKFTCNKYKMEFHVEQCIEGGKRPKVYIIEK